MSNLLKPIATALLNKAGLDLRNRRFAYINPLEDLARILDGTPAPTILDVGANRGDTVAEYRKLFPESQIHAFEPTPELVDELTARFRTDSRVKVVPLAVSSEVGTTKFYCMSENVMNSMISLVSDKSYHGATNEKSIDVQTTTITDYCRKSGITSVQILKLDIQGAEKLALAGAKSMIESGQIDTIYLEIFFASAYSDQTTFSEISSVLHTANYRLYGFYELNRESNGSLDFCNALYLSPQVYSKLNPHYLY